MREFTELEGHIGADLREARRLSATRSSRAIDEQYLPDSAGGPLPRPSRARCSPRPTSSTHCASRSGSASARPARATRSGSAARRSGSAGSRPKAACTIDRALLPDDVRDFVEERLEGLLDVPVEFVRAARASAVRRPRRRRAARAQALHAAERSDEFAAVYEAYDRAQRLAGKRDDAADAVDAALFEHDTERELAERRREPRARSGERPASRWSGPRGRADRVAVLRRRDGGRRGRRRARRTACGCCSTCATGSAGSATSRRSRARWLISGSPSSYRRSAVRCARPSAEAPLPEIWSLTLEPRRSTSSFRVDGEPHARLRRRDQARHERAVERGLT